MSASVDDATAGVIAEVTITWSRTMHRGAEQRAHLMHEFRLWRPVFEAALLMVAGLVASSECWPGAGVPLREARQALRGFLMLLLRRPPVIV